MRFLSLFLFSLPLLVLIGCSSSNSAIPTITTTTASVAGDSTAIYWLDEKQSFPVSLTEHVTMGDYGHYQSEYKWRNGVLRELLRQGEVFAENRIQSLFVHIRYDSEGQAVYQRYRVGGDLLPLRPTELVKYAAEAQRSLDTVKQQKKIKQKFLQGFWNDGKLVECDTDTERNISFPSTFPGYVKNRLDKEDNFIAATGKVGRRQIEISEIILLESDDYDCLERPEIEVE